eukprot:Gregarina_sp_Poly_1__333@NODE_107_length_14129_cov_139_662779_g94_i0_p2_GENE_NODE_107_length_14129_cov_139_662779_g94_i0NODE_107_length_14129_cov_139_662779_g94_i0_p2_ORF_typecomplete_len582_score90_72PCI/PF01399_27/2_8e03PCI/PF01399_27/5_5e03PCI/PF01399_27/2_2e14Rpn3_C/PF08375_11/1_4e04Rpn3_C/PF08375_11/8_2e15TPR_MalT/PF17874_1/2_8TPR_MalT/PF17874_1/5_7CSN8_PSD8_EIF3K/PF10075_9/0_049DUF410/PF04190_13/0_25_NODE_107_length_14129_cov_139_662779_g94_i032354980
MASFSIASSKSALAWTFSSAEAMDSGKERICCISKIWYVGVITSAGWAPAIFIFRAEQKNWAFLNPMPDTNPRELYLARVKECVEYIQKSVRTKEEKDISRVLRRLPLLRREVILNDFESLCSHFIKDSALGVFFQLIKAADVWSVPDVEMKESTEEETASNEAEPTTDTESAANAQLQAIKDEICADSPGYQYVCLLMSMLVVFLAVDTFIKTQRQQRQSGVEILDKGIELSYHLKQSLRKVEDFAFDVLDAKAYFALYRLYHLAGRGVEVRPFLLEAFRISTLERKELCQAALINQLIQSYIDASEHDFAIKFVLKTAFPENIRSTTQVVRCLFNLGRIQAVRLEYSDAHEKLMTAVKKLPPDEDFAKGFKLLALKHAIIVELLMGDVPDVALFRNQPKLTAYEGIVQAVRQGDLAAFTKVFENYCTEYQRDGTLFLVERLRHSVIKAGLRKINNSYLRIPLADIAIKLGIKSVEDAESIVAKSIMDGIVTGVIDTEHQCLISQQSTEKYASAEPAEVFNKRIQFCSNMTKDAIKAMQYPEEDSIKARAAEAERRRREQQEEMARTEEFDGSFEDEMDL